MFKSYHFFITGDTPLLMHNPRSMVSDVKKKGKRTIIPTPEEEAEIGSYRDPDGNLVFPSSGPRKCFLRAMVGYKVGRRALRSFLNHVRTKEEWIPILDPKTKENLREYEIDTRRVVIKMAGIMRSRPRLDQWAMEVIFIMNADIAEMKEEDLLEKSTAILNEGGQTVGIGDFRLEKSGWFGMFHVESSHMESS